MKLTPFLLFDGHCAEAGPALRHLRPLADMYGVHWFFQGGGSAEQPG